MKLKNDTSSMQIVKTVIFVNTLLAVLIYLTAIV